MVDSFLKLLNRNFIEIFFYGLISGMPFSIFYTALTTWLIDSKFPLEVVTSIAIARVFYSFKYIWAPLVDRWNLPILHRIGRRKSWMALCLILIFSLILTISQISATEENFKLILILSIIMGFASATYDIAFDAFRIDRTKPEDQATAVACAVSGYRFGMLFIGSGSLIISNYYGWSFFFQLVAFVYFLAILYVKFLKEDLVETQKGINLKESFKIAVIEPFRDYFSRNYAILILVAIILFKAGDVLLGAVSTPFYLHLGYTKPQIGYIVKLFGFGATLTGVFVGGKIVQKYGNFKGLILCGIVQAIVNLSFIWLHYAEVAVFSLAAVICIENIGGGMGTAAEVGFISTLCNKKFSATQYALLSSVAVMLNSTLAAFAGYITKSMGWDLYFILTVLISFPSLLMFWYIYKNREA